MKNPDDVFFAPSMKFSIKRSEFAGFRTAYQCSEWTKVFIAIHGQPVGNAESQYHNQSAGILGRSETTARHRSVKELELDYYGDAGLKKDLDALKEFLS